MEAFSSGARESECRLGKLNVKALNAMKILKLHHGTYTISYLLFLQGN